MNQLWHDERGMAGIEMAVSLIVLTMICLNGIELARWFYTRMELASAAQMATQNAWKACDTSHLPATVNCSELNTAISNSLAATRLGRSVTQASGSPSEGYYCVNSIGELTLVAQVPASKPSNCSAVGDSAHVPGDYLSISVTMNYVPLFNNITVGRYLPSPISTNKVRLQ